MDRWESSLASEFRRIIGANYIGNYGMDAQYAEAHRVDRILCHRVGKDIVIPQYMGQWSNMFLVHNNLYRQYDSVWAGSIWGDRDPLVRINVTMEEDYVKLHTERYKASYSGRRLHSSTNSNSDSNFDLELFDEENNHKNAHHNHHENNDIISRRLIEAELAHQGYFGYNPCGDNCWSQRLYFQLNQHTIPVIVSSGGLLPFDRFLNWKAFTMKITSEIWNSEKDLTTFRQFLRLEADKFRSILDKYFEHYIELKKLQTLRRSYELIKNKIVSNIDYDGAETPYFQELKETYIWKKREQIKLALPWLYIKNDIKHDMPKHAFRLLTLELWCRLYEREKEKKNHNHDHNHNHNSNSNSNSNESEEMKKRMLIGKICENDPSRTSRMSYY